MKTLKLFLFGVAMLLVLSCNNSDVSLLGSRQIVTFKATLADAQITKTVLQSNGSVFWNPGNAINLFYGDSGSARFEADVTSPAAYANFNGSLNGFTPGGSDYFWAVYPYDSSNEFDGSAITVTLPDEQTAVEGTFADDLFISMACSNGYSLQFYNVCGGVKFSVANEGIKYVILKGNANEVLAGEVKVGFGNDGKPQVQQVLDGKTEIRLDAPGGGTFEVGQWYYIVALPATFTSGYTMTFYKDEQFAERITDSSIELKRSVWGKLANADDSSAPITANKYLTFTSEGETTLYLTNNGGNAPVLYYSADAQNWTLWDYSALTFTNNSPLYICGDNADGFSYSETMYSEFGAYGDFFDINGDIMSLIDKDYDIFQIPRRYCFYSLFRYCYALKTAPDLSATTLDSYCYMNMFRDCGSLTVAPVISAVILANGCCYLMFADCTSLQTTPELSATALSEKCYRCMFLRCTSLVSVTDLPATTLADDCYGAMFEDCTSLLHAPNLPATTLAFLCYASMFSGCSSLQDAPELPATILAEQCYSNMFRGCAHLTVAPELPASTLVDRCYNSMFYDCYNLSSVKCLATDLSIFNCVENWLDGVSRTGTFVKATAMEDWPIGPSGIPEGWTVVNDSDNPSGGNEGTDDEDWT